MFNSSERTGLVRTKGMASMQRSTIAGLVVTACLVTGAIAETRKEFRFTVGPKANIVVDNQYGFATKLLEAQHEYFSAVLAAAAPVLPKAAPVTK